MTPLVGHEDLLGDVEIVSFDDCSKDFEGDGGASPASSVVVA